MHEKCTSKLAIIKRAYLLAKQPHANNVQVEKSIPKLLPRNYNNKSN